MKKRILVCILLVLVLLTGAAAVFAMLQLRKTNYIKDEEVELFTEVLETETEAPLTAEMLYHPENVSHISDEQAKGTWCLLVIGEGSEDNNWRESAKALRDEIGLAAAGEETAQTESEADDITGYGEAQGIILMVINHNRKTVYFYSFHKDLYARIGDYGGYRLGDAYMAGGGPLLRQTIEDNYGVRIDQYASIRLADVAHILKMEEFEDLDISNCGIDVIENLVFSMKDIAPSQMAGYVSKLLPFVSHNLTDMQIMKMVLQIPNIVAYGSVKGKIPYDGLYEKVGDLLVPDIEMTSAHLQKSIYGTEEGQTDSLKNSMTE